MMLINLPLPFTERQVSSNLSKLASMPQDDESVQHEIRVQNKYLEAIKKRGIKNG